MKYQYQNKIEDIVSFLEGATLRYKHGYINFYKTEKNKITLSVSPKIDQNSNYSMKFKNISKYGKTIKEGMENFLEIL